MAKNRLKSLYFRHRNIVPPFFKSLSQRLYNVQCRWSYFDPGFLQLRFLFMVCHRIIPVSGQPTKGPKRNFGQMCAAKDFKPNPFQHNICTSHCCHYHYSYDEEIPNFKLFEGHNTIIFFFFLRSWIQSFRIQLEGNSPYKIAQGYQNYESQHPY